MARVLAMMLVAMSLLCAGFVSAEVYITDPSCENLNFSGENVYLQTNVVMTPGASYCFKLDTGTLDCSGYSITGDSGLALVQLENQGALRQCILNPVGETDGVEVLGNQTVIELNTFNGNGIGAGLNIITGELSSISNNVFQASMLQFTEASPGTGVSFNTFNGPFNTASLGAIYNPAGAGSIAGNIFNITAVDESSNPDCAYTFGEFTENWGAVALGSNYYIGLCGQATNFSLTCTDADRNGMCDAPFLFDLAVDISDDAPLSPWNYAPNAGPDIYTCDGYAESQLGEYLSIANGSIVSCSGNGDPQADPFTCNLFADSVDVGPLTLLSVPPSPYTFNVSDAVFAPYIGVPTTFVVSCSDGYGAPGVDTSENFNLNISPSVPPCSPSWVCSDFGVCESNNVSACSNVTDTNVCGELFAGTLSDYDNLSCGYVVPCSPNWVCNDFAACLETNVSACLNVTDLNVCGQEFNGTLGDYDNTSCDYLAPCSPSWVCSSIGDCTQANVRLCSAVDDANNCNEVFNGSLATYNVACTYPTGNNPLGVGGSVGGSGSRSAAIVPQAAIGTTSAGGSSTDAFKGFFLKLWDFIVFWD